ncbi:hypothetical protein [uncultured Alistipes sp.]|uniref:hypothetical protein n=1 Tax=uncultured Alistipes sp. TaxID=538949 RepID=UPI00263B2B16|nr:hypothetical protein [uncultured Alistipes sp.]
MKKTIFLLSIIFLFTACRMLDIFRTTKTDPTHTVIWCVKNRTQQPVRLLMRDWGKEKNIAPGDSINLFRVRFPQVDGIPTFDPFFKCWQTDYWGDEQYLTIFSADGEVLKRWKYTPESVAEDPFFQESSWRFYQKEYETNSELELTWVYDLRPEDLVSDETVY